MSEPTPMRAGHRGSRTRLQAGQASRITPAHIRQAAANLDRRPEPAQPVWRRVLPQLLVVMLLPVLGYGVSLAWQLRHWPLLVLQSLGVVCVLALYYLELFSSRRR
jgi:hypothetical protein